MTRYVTRSIWITLIGFSIIFAVWLAPSRANTQRPYRIVVRKPFPVEPVKIVAIKTKKNERIQLGMPFEADDDWLDGFSVTVVNHSDKIVTAITVEMIFRREPGDTRPPLARELHFGPSPSGLEYLRRNPNKVIKVGQRVELQLSPENYETLKRDLEQLGYSNGVSRIELAMAEVGFEDGSVLSSGTLFLPDPKSPGDPTKKIKAPGPLRAHSYKARRAAEHKSIGNLGSFLKTSFTWPNITQGDCRAKEWQPRHFCDQPVTCDVRRDILEPFEPGEWTTELVFSHCERFTDTGYVDCPNLVEDVERYVFCPLENRTENQFSCTTGLECCSGFCGEWHFVCMECQPDPQQHGECMSEACSSCYLQGGVYCTGAGGNCWTPIVIDVSGNGFALTDAANGVNFNDGNGTVLRTAWTTSKSDDAWLVLDRNNNGTIDDGSELFGNAAPQPAPPPSELKNGFRALAEYDKLQNGGNGDNAIDQHDAVFDSLKVWQDTNHNGVSEANELYSLRDLNLSSIRLDYKLSKRRDGKGNTFRYRAKVTDSTGAQLGRWAYDVFLDATRP